jgi:archaellum component FlaC
MKIITLTTEFYLDEIEFLLKSLENDIDNINIIIGGIGLSDKKINNLKNKFKFVEFKNITDLCELCNITSDEIKQSIYGRVNNIIKIKPFFAKKNDG